MWYAIPSSAAAVAASTLFSLGSGVYLVSPDPYVSTAEYQRYEATEQTPEFDANDPRLDSFVEATAIFLADAGMRGRGA